MNKTTIIYNKDKYEGIDFEKPNSIRKWFCGKNNKHFFIFDITTPNNPVLETTFGNNILSYKLAISLFCETEFKQRVKEPKNEKIIEKFVVTKSNYKEFIELIKQNIETPSISVIVEKDLLIIKELGYIKTKQLIERLKENKTFYPKYYVKTVQSNHYFNFGKILSC